MNIIGAEHPFFRPAIRRYTAVGTCVIWTIIEWSYGDPFWGVLSSGLAGLSAYELILTYDQKYGSKSVDKDKTPDAKP
jgi:hypothetical protein